MVSNIYNMYVCFRVSSFPYYKYISYFQNKVKSIVRSIESKLEFPYWNEIRNLHISTLEIYPLFSTFAAISTIEPSKKY